MIISRNEEPLFCPVCGCDYTHLNEIEEYKEDGKTCAILYFGCEEGCEFAIDVHQHEGMTFVAVKNTKSH